jgi:hypothetical protein
MNTIKNYGLRNQCAMGQNEKTVTETFQLQSAQK